MTVSEGELKARKPLLVCLGFGAVAQCLAARLEGWRVVGTHRAAVAAPDRLAFDGAASPALRDAIADADAVLCSIPPDDDGCSAFRALEETLRAAPPAWCGYLSTTGVYGDHAGRWVFEWTPPRPQSIEAQRRRRAETQWLSLPRPGHVFRLPGLYGPGRSALDRVRAGDARRMVKPGHVFSRAHIDDVAAALACSIARPNPGRLYNIADDEPAPSADVTAHAAQLLGIDAGPEEMFDAATLSPMAQRFWAESRRVANARAKSELGWRPAYPTYREGLAAILAQGG
ncbi:MAG: SDR family NAD(P)-dependent oxidoreductase [Hyphomonadaceae bacterium]|nr:SDR family NAD(P)-dependent oxidoreductase [Hyphomonadaceae bacterium]